MPGSRCVHYGRSLAWVEALSAEHAVQRSLALAPLGDWTSDPADLSVVAQDAYPQHSRRGDYTRAVLNS